MKDTPAETKEVEMADENRPAIMEEAAKKDMKIAKENDVSPARN